MTSALTVRRLRLGAERWEAAFGPRLVRLPPDMAKEAVRALETVLDSRQPEVNLPPGEAIQAEVELDRRRYLIDVRGSPGGIERRVTEEDGLPCPDFYDRIRLSPEEESLSTFSPDPLNPFSERFRRYRDAETFYPSRAFFSALTDGIGRTDTFRTCLNRHIRDALPEPLPCRQDCRIVLRDSGQFAACRHDGQAVRLNREEERVFELMCFLSVNRFWQTLEAVRDLHYAPRPLFMIAAGSSDCRRQALSLGRQVFVCESGYNV